jgi:dUTP pyrophosphatase
MQIKIKRIDKELPLPAYQTAGSAGFDIYARENAVIASKAIALVPSNLIIATPPGFMLVVASRSSTPKRKGLMIANGIGVVDSDYSGPEDEVKILVYNFTDNEVLVEKGERIAQGLFVKVEQGQWEEVDGMSTKTRGGFGSTGS